MRLALIVIYVCVAVVLLPGCEEQAQRDLSPEPDTALHYRELRKENDELRSRNRILDARLEEQLAREQRLSEVLNKMKFLNVRQIEQIDALKGAAAARDAYRTQAEQLTAEVAQLRKKTAELEQLTKRIAELESEIDTLNRENAALRARPTTTTPAATQPATAPTGN